MMFGIGMGVHMLPRGVRGMAMLALNNIRDNPGSKRVSKRVGRGVGSGKGKTCGRGHKGQKSRAGNHGLKGKGFEGGQTPIHKRVPKWGFSNAKFKIEFNSVNLSRIHQWIIAGRIDASKPITMKELFDSNLSGKIKHGVKLLGVGAEKFDIPITIEVSRASKSAIEAVEKAGGTIVCSYYNRVGLRALLRPDKFDPERMPLRARPKPKKMRFYNDNELRGYLSPEMQLKLKDEPWFKF